ncbi:MAG TPA: methionyl-tRNA formyltransferase [Casimicrobiaceae bacterium]|nr:methionyl-tRNA formyltransferase [Casimicrobiaceae bacterium]
MRRLRVGFAGTPPFAATALEAILRAGFAVPLVLTQPDRPSGRGLAIQPSAVKALAAQRGLAVQQPSSLRTEEARASLVAVALDVLVVAAYGLILPPAVLAWPRAGGLNIHASLLPRWRGAAPVQHALLAGDRETGVTIMQMDAGLDTGPTIERVEVAVGARETAGSLTSRLAEAGAALIVAVLDRLEVSGHLETTAQPTEGATYAGKVDRSQAELDWRHAAAALDRKVRAFDPVPGAYFRLGDATVKVWSAEPLKGSGPAGTVLDLSADAIEVACGEGSLRLRTLQPAGGRRMSGGAFASGRGLARGAALA